MKKIIIGVVIIAIAGVAFVVSNSTNDIAKETEQRNKVSATIFPVYDITRVIAGDEFEVVLLLQPGASPHTFDPQPSIIKEMTGSSALFTIGHGVDDWSHNLADSLDIPVVVVDGGIALRETRKDEHNEHEEENGHDEHGDEELHEEENGHDEHGDEELHEEENGHDEHGHGPIDPHYWLSLTNAEQITQNIAEELARLDKTNANIYLQRAEDYKKELRALRTELEQQVQSISNRNIVSLHDAWEYFAGEFDLNIVGTFEPAGGVSPSPKDLVNLGKEVKEHNVSMIFIEPQLSKDSVTAFAQDHNLGIALLDPLGGIDERQSYLDLIRYNVNQVVSAPKE